MHNKAQLLHHFLFTIFHVCRLNHLSKNYFQLILLKKMKSLVLHCKNISLVLNCLIVLDTDPLYPR